MRSNITRITGRILICSAFIALLLSLLSLTSFPAFAQQQDGGGTHVIVSLKHAPTGVATLQWNPQTTVLTVTLTVSGLQAKSTHPAHIHSGDCSSDGAIVYPLNNVIADAAGNAITTTTIKNVSGGIPANGWHINVHSGPTLSTPNEAIPVACGEIVNKQTNTNAPQTASTLLGSTNAPNQNASGTATLSLDQGVLTVTTTVSNLVPGSQHAAHIHLGSCEVQSPGSILYHLMPLQADSHGVATSTTTIKGVTTIPSTGWYINIHFSTDLSTQAGYDVIDCGDVAG